MKDVSIEFYAGEVHALVGENGAGKSTLIKLIAGADSPTDGQILVDGVPHSSLTPRVSIELGISAVYQEFNLIPELSVAENIYFGREPVMARIFQRRSKMTADAQRLINELGVPIDAGTSVRNLSVGFQQIVEIAKGLSLDSRVFVLDEPTAPLTAGEVEHLYRVVRELRRRRVAVIFISHRLQEVFDLCDKVTVLRDGSLVAINQVQGLTRADLIAQMVGREITEVFPPHQEERSVGNVALSVRNLCTTSLLRDVTLEVRYGEIVGLAGLVGAGRTEIAKVVFGAAKYSAGDILVDGAKLLVRNPYQAIKAGIGLIPEDRKAEGLVLQRAVGENITYANLPKLSRLGMIAWHRVERVQAEYGKKLAIRTPSMAQITRHLSGGNQQKVVVAKWLATQCRILIFDEPTRGVDVGAKQEIYRLMRALAAQGRAVIMISSEMPELLGMCDRLYVLREGTIVGELSGGAATQEEILHLAAR